MTARKKYITTIALVIAITITALMLPACNSDKTENPGETSESTTKEAAAPVSEQEAIMNEFETLNEEDYTPATYRLAKAAADELSALIESASADTAALDLAADNLQQAMNSLRNGNASQSLAQTYEDYFLLGTIFGDKSNFDTNNDRGALTRKHFNSLTAENCMKPDQLSSGGAGTEGAFVIGESKKSTADDLVSLAQENGYTVHGHVLVWHSQSPAWVNGGLAGETTREQAKANMEHYIKTVVEHFDTNYPGVVTSWDVVNEALVDGVNTVSSSADWRNFLRESDQSAWYKAYSNGMAEGEDPSDFIYDAFVFARKYTDAKLFYNDFNMYQDGKSKLAAKMATELNEKYKNEFPDDPRKLIEGIGMQSHNYIMDTPATSVENGIKNIIAADIDVAISELDLFCWFPWNAEPTAYMDLKDRGEEDIIGSQGSSTEKNYWITKGITNGTEIEIVQAERYAEYFKVYKNYADHIDRVTFWGLNDQQNWRSGHNPMLWNSDWTPKDAFFAVSDPDSYLNQ